MTRTFCPASYLATALMLSLWAGNAGANALGEMPPDQKMARSDTVIVGTVTGSDYADGQYITVKVRAVVKGVATGVIRVHTSGSFAEENLPPDMVGREYVLFLHKTADGAFRAVNGHFGAVPVALDLDTAQVP